LYVNTAFFTQLLILRFLSAGATGWSGVYWLTPASLSAGEFGGGCGDSPNRGGNRKRNTKRRIMRRSRRMKSKGSHLLAGNPRPFGGGGGGGGGGVHAARKALLDTRKFIAWII